MHRDTYEKLPSLKNEYSQVKQEIQEAERDLSSKADKATETLSRAIDLLREKIQSIEEDIQSLENDKKDLIVKKFVDELTELKRLKEKQGVLSERIEQIRSQHHLDYEEEQLIEEGYTIIENEQSLVRLQSTRTIELLASQGVPYKVVPYHSPHARESWARVWAKKPQ